MKYTQMEVQNARHHTNVSPNTKNKNVYRCCLVGKAYNMEITMLHFKSYLPGFKVSK